MIAEYTVNLNNKTKDELIMLVKEGLEVIKNQQAELEVYKDIKELAGTEIKEILSWKYENKRLKSEIEKLRNNNKELLKKLRNRVKEVKKLTKYSLYKKEFATLNKQLEEKDKYISKLENKLMYALSPTTHELALTTQEQFKTIIRNNLKEDTYTIKRLLKEYWEDK